MKRNLAMVGPGLATMAFLAAVPVFVTTAGAILAGAASFAFLGYRAYRRIKARPG